ncbi:MAG TPA: exo-alpha-sialidase, partial [Thermoplasmata archaeon]|nr:exo-alpha-sialidase [Thermoplasmata archaeon]
MIVAMGASGAGDTASGPEADSASIGQVDQVRSAPFLKPIMVSGTQPVFGEWHSNVLPNGNIIVGWIDVASGVGCGFTTSTDNGKTWSPPSVMEASANSGGDPVVTVDADGTVYRSCILTPKSGGGDGTWYQKSTDGGLTWDTATKRAVQPFDDYQWAATDKGTIWQVFNNGNAGMRVSTDEGKTWGSESTVSNGWPSCIQFTEGTIYGFSGQEGQQMQFFKSTDRGATWTKKNVLTIKGGSRGECVYDAVRKDLWFVWAQGGFGNTGNGPSTAVQVLHSSDLGETFDPAVVVYDPKASSDFASLGVDVSGGLHVAWMDKSGGFAQAWYSNSTDKGKTWSTPLKVSDHTSASGAQYIHYGKGLTVTPTGTVCFSYPAPGSTSSSTSMFVACGAAASQGVARVGVVPATATITTDQTQQFTATAYDSNNNPLQGITFSWAATDGSVGASGLLTPQKTGTHTVTATAQGKSGTAQVTVNPGAAVSVSIAPPTATI